MVLRGGKQSLLWRLGNMAKVLFDNMWSEHMLKVEKTRILSSRSRWNCLYINNVYKYKGIRAAN